MANTKEYAATLWNNLSEGLDELYQKYKSTRAHAQSVYEEGVYSLQSQAAAQKKNTATTHRITQKNTDLRMAERGLAASGEAMRAELLADAALTGALSDIDAQSLSAQAELAKERQATEAELDRKESEEVADYVYRMNQAYFEQANQDREEARREQELALEREEMLFEQKMREEELALEKRKQTLAENQQKAEAQKQKAASASSSSSASAKGSAGVNTILGAGGSKFLIPTQGLTPDSYNARQLLEGIVERHTTTSYNGAKNYDYTAIRHAINSVLADKTIDQTFRYELSFYSRTLGWI